MLSRLVLLLRVWAAAGQINTAAQTARTFLCWHLMGWIVFLPSSSPLACFPIAAVNAALIVVMLLRANVVQFHESDATSIVSIGCMSDGITYSTTLHSAIVSIQHIPSKQPAAYHTPASCLLATRANKHVG